MRTKSIRESIKKNPIVRKSEQRIKNNARDKEWYVTKDGELVSNQTRTSSMKLTELPYA